MPSSTVVGRLFDYYTRILIQLLLMLCRAMMLQRGVRLRRARLLAATVVIVLGILLLWKTLIVLMGKCSTV